MHGMLYEELRQSEKEILHSLQKKHPDNQLMLWLEEELADIRLAIKKVENGNFGLCEISGEIIPEKLLELVPTIKSLSDVSKMDSFYRKSIHFHS